MKSTRRQVLILLGEAACILVIHYVLWVWIANQEIAARLLAAGEHLPRPALAVAVIFVVIRFFALVILPGVVLARLAGLAWQLWGPK